jgi:hypothetical protein
MGKGPVAVVSSLSKDLGLTRLIRFAAMEKQFLLVLIIQENSLLGSG